MSITEINAETGEVEIREATAQELAQRELDETAEAEKASAGLIKAEAKAALLARLGITADEAALLLA